MPAMDESPVQFKMCDKKDQARKRTGKTHGNELGFGGGCHWCTEAVFASLRGVLQVQQGFIRSHAPHDSYSEAVLVNFDSSVVSLDTLIEIHLRTHASSSSHSMREKYRSAVYVHDDRQSQYCKSAIASLQQSFEKPLITRVLQIEGFTLSEDRYRNYYATNPDRPFCATRIEPKLAMLRRDFSEYCLQQPGLAIKHFDCR